jgi:hypothetical protein
VIASGTAFLDDRRIGNDLWVVRTNEEVERLYALMMSKSRRNDICVFSLAENEQDPTKTAASAYTVHWQTLGAGHVVVLTGSAAFMLTDLVGREFSVFNRAVRTYRPGFDTDADDPLRHPIAMAHRIAAWQENGIEGSQAFESFIVRSTIRQTVSRSDLEQVLPPFSKVRRLANIVRLDDARDAGASNDDLLLLYEEEHSKLQAALEEDKALHAGLLDASDRERAEAQRRAEEAKSEVSRLYQRIRTLESLVKAQAGSDEPPIPTDFGELKNWADKYLAGSVFIANRALRGANISEYEEPTLVYRALLLLRDYYVPMRREGGDEHRQRYKTALHGLGLSEDGSITATRLGEQGDEYLTDRSPWRSGSHMRTGSRRSRRNSSAPRSTPA